MRTLLSTIGQFFKFWFWDKWHGVAISEFGERRATIKESPSFEIGNIRIPYRVFYIIFGLVLLFLIFGIVFKVKFTNQAGLQTQPGIVTSSGCFAKDSDGRLFVALDCLKEMYGGYLVYFIAPIAIFLVFLGGFFLGIFYERRKTE